MGEREGVLGNGSLIDANAAFVFGGVMHWVVGVEV